MKIIIAGGGTGGHIIPNIAILESLKKQVKDLDVLYVGSKKGLEAELIPREGYAFETISCGKLRRYFSWENFLDVFRTMAGICQSAWIIAQFKPEVIFFKGGYVGFGMAIAGGLMRKKVIIHESDLKMGLGNRLAARMADKICVSFPETVEAWRGDSRVVLTGNPVRAGLAEGNAEKGWKFSGLKPGKKMILIMGGSQGSKSVNNLIEKNLEDLLKDFQIIHICGKGNLPEYYAKLSTTERANYFACEYVGDELKDIYAVTDMMISRAGANTLAEIDFLGKPAILIPLVEGSRGDQVENAESFVKNHSAVVLRENQSEDFDLKKALKELLNKPERAIGKNQAADKIAKIIMELANRKNV